MQTLLGNAGSDSNKEMKFHAIANIFPLMGKAELDDLAADIKANGQRETILTHEGQILDGRNRWLACELAGVAPRHERFKNGSPTALVVSLNLKRRHLSDSQKAAVATEVLPWLEREAKQRQKRKPANFVRPKIDEQKRSDEQAGKLFGVSRSYVADAKAIKAKAPELFEQVKSGDKTITEAKRQLKREAHAKTVEHFANNPVQPSGGPYDLILADPPWEYDYCEAGNREIQNHYQTVSLEEIGRHKEHCNSKDDCVLFLWATAPKLREAIAIMETWGFNYRTCAVWDKLKIGMGYWFRIQHELLLVGVKGSPGATPEPERISSVFQEIRGRHSAKPECVYRWIERAFPASVKLEMYCRSPRKGWASWGNEI